MKHRARSCLSASDVPPGRAFALGQRNSLESYLPFTPNEPQNGFMRGAIAAGLLAAISPEGGRKEVLKRALQGGAALAAGIAGANAIDRRDLGSALWALAAGAAGLTAIDYLLPNSQASKKGSAHE